jgi:hypothetical protein
MKVGIAMFLLCLIAGMMLSQQPNSNPAKQQTAEAANTQQNASVAGKKQPEAGSDHATKSNDSSPAWYTSPEWAAVVVAAIGIGIIGWQSWETRKAANATKDGVDMQISKERARVRIIANEPGLYPPPAGAWVRWTLENYGATYASVRMACARLVVTPERETIPDYSKCKSMFIGESIKPDTRPQVLSQIFIEPDVAENELLEIKKGNLFVHFYGFVQYQDVFERNWRRRIHLRWAMRWGGTFEGMIMQWWELAGSPEENADISEDLPKPQWWKFDWLRRAIEATKKADAEQAN